MGKIHPTDFRSEKNHLKISATRWGRKCEKWSQDLGFFGKKYATFWRQFSQKMCPKMWKKNSFCTFLQKIRKRFSAICRKSTKSCVPNRSRNVRKRFRNENAESVFGRVFQHVVKNRKYIFKNVEKIFFFFGKNKINFFKNTTYFFKNKKYVYNNLFFFIKNKIYFYKKIYFFIKNKIYFYKNLFFL